MGRELAGTNMTDSPHMTGVLAPDELAVLDRVLSRLSGRLILNQFAKDEAATLAMNLFQCGFTHEDKLLDQLVETIKAPPQVR